MYLEQRRDLTVVHWHWANICHIIESLQIYSYSLKSLHWLLKSKWVTLNKDMNVEIYLSTIKHNKIWIAFLFLGFLVCLCRLSNAQNVWDTKHANPWYPSLWIACKHQKTWDMSASKIAKANLQVKCFWLENFCLEDNVRNGIFFTENYQFCLQCVRFTCNYSDYFDLKNNRMIYNLLLTIFPCKRCHVT